VSRHGHFFCAHIQVQYAYLYLPVGISYIYIIHSSPYFLFILPLLHTFSFFSKKNLGYLGPRYQLLSRVVFYKHIFFLFICHSTLLTYSCAFTYLWTKYWNCNHFEDSDAVKYIMILLLEFEHFMKYKILKYFMKHFKSVKYFNFYSYNDFCFFFIL